MKSGKGKKRISNRKKFRCVVGEIKLDNRCKDQCADCKWAVQMIRKREEQNIFNT